MQSWIPRLDRNTDICEVSSGEQPHKQIDTAGRQFTSVSTQGQRRRVDADG